MPLPLIGLTAIRYEDKDGHSRIGIGEAYIQAIAQAGGAPILIPLGLPNPTLDEIVSRLDGILFTGGGDIEPHVYGAQREDPRAGSIDADRDRVEFTLFDGVIQKGLPFLGICRGLQLINVALGGSLYVDITEDMPSTLVHQNGSIHPRDYLAHTVQVDQTSRLVRILNAEQVLVNSLHHQGIRHLGNHLNAVAQAPDGLVEAFEMSDYPYGLAVQWHPECLQAHEPMRRIFRSFVEAAQKRMR
jgi:putative glutamine amidotransferase